jgi:predicted outer membrane lipoprotein
MEIILIAAVIVGLWLVLNHIRRQQFLKEYLELQHKALDKGVGLPAELKEIVTAKTDWAAVSLRVGILSLVLGIMGVIIGMVILPSQSWSPKDADTAAVFAVFWAFGLLLAAFGIGNLICWVLIDKKKRGKKTKGE